MTKPLTSGSLLALGFIGISDVCPSPPQRSHCAAQANIPRTHCPAHIPPKPDSKQTEHTANPMHSPKHALPRTGVGELSEGPTTSAVNNTTAASSCPEDESSVPDWDFPVWKILGAAWAGANEFFFSVTQGLQGQSHH